MCSITANTISLASPPRPITKRPRPKFALSPKETSDLSVSRRWSLYEWPLISSSPTPSAFSSTPSSRSVSPQTSTSTSSPQSSTPILPTRIEPLCSTSSRPSALRCAVVRSHTPNYQEFLKLPSSKSTECIPVISASSNSVLQDNIGNTLMLVALILTLFVLFTPRLDGDHFVGSRGGS